MMGRRAVVPSPEFEEHLEIDVETKRGRRNQTGGIEQVIANDLENEENEENEEEDELNEFEEDELDELDELDEPVVGEHIGERVPVDDDDEADDDDMRF